MPFLIVPLGGAVRTPMLVAVPRFGGGPVIRRLVASWSAFGTSGGLTATVMPGNGRLNTIAGKLNALPAPAPVATSLPKPDTHPCGLANIVIVIAGVGTIVIEIV